MHLPKSRYVFLDKCSLEQRTGVVQSRVGSGRFPNLPVNSQRRSEALSDIRTSLVSADLICCLYVFITPLGSRKHCYLSAVCLPFSLLLQSV